MDNELHNYVKLIESAHQNIEDDVEIDEECECGEEFDEAVNYDVDTDESTDESEEKASTSDDVLDEDSSFWENFEKDSDFELDENNGMYCVRGVDTSFHYGSHVDYDCAADHIESLRNYQS